MKDLKALSKWLTANKISLNGSKTELLYFKNNNISPGIKIKLQGKLIFPSEYVKYLGVFLDEKLSGIKHCEELVKKLNRSNGMLSRARHFMPLDDLKKLFHAIFSSHLMYSCQVWNQKLISVTNKISTLQNKALRIMTFSDFNAHSEPLFKNLNILKFSDSITLKNCLFAYDFLRGRWHSPRAHSVGLTLRWDRGGSRPPPRG